MVNIEGDIETALTDLVMNCPELVELEGRISRFNIFRVLKAERHEIRHSNMLAWLFDPEESHGLGDRFLRRWLMNVVHDAAGHQTVPEGLPSPIEIDALDIDYVDVKRELSQIDLLVRIQTGTEKTWVVCIENKIETAQHSNQLRRYREYVEHSYADAEKRLYVFLTKHEEVPEEPGFITSSHEVIEGVLRSCLTERGNAIGPEPKLLVEQYLELLAEDFVEDNRTAQLARQIYRRHKKALDYILECREDPISEASAAMQDILTASASEFGILMTTSYKGYVRFLPTEWAVPQNIGGTAWGPNSRFVCCEVYFWSKTVELHIVVGKAPEYWADLIWAAAAKPPFKQEWRQRPAQYIKPFKARSEIPVNSLVEMAPEDRRARLLEWIQRELKDTRFRQAVEKIRDLLAELRTK